MNWIILVVVTLVVIVALLALIGLCLPREHRATTRARFRADAGTVFAVLSDVEGYPEWRPGVRSVRWVEPVDGHPAYVEETRTGPVRYMIEASEPPRKFVGRIADEKLAYGGTWTFVLVPDGAGTQLSVTEDGSVKPVIFRTLARFVFGYHATMEQYLKALGKKLGETVTVERVTGPSD